MHLSYVLPAVLVMAATTFLFRAAPFLALQKVADAPLVRYLGLAMPAGVMVILVFYSLSTVKLTVPPYGVPSLVGVGATLWMHAWRRNPLLSIVIGTGSYIGALHLMT